MRIKVKKLGALRQAEFSLSNLTIICGGNNTGKTYATYALFGFLHTWQQFFTVPINNTQIEALMTDGVTTIEIQDYVEQLEKITDDGCREYTKSLSKIFSSSPENFKNTYFEVAVQAEDIDFSKRFYQETGTSNIELFSIEKEENSSTLVVTLLVDRKDVKVPQGIIKRIISDSVRHILFSDVFPRPLIASAERTGAAIFRKELNFARNRLLEEISQTDKSLDGLDRMKLLFKDYQDYALPVKENVEFTRKLESIFRKDSFITQEHPHIIEEFSDIIGGEYTVTRDDELYYLPKNRKKTKLSMDESSSAVRSLLDIGFYIKHEVMPGDLLIVDEPELNLHPENQRRVARLFAQLVNIGVRIFITTHSAIC